ncbi:MAG: nucleotide exchange factor GrpE [Candidatus Omnitrophota bacterium]
MTKKAENENNAKELEKRVLDLEKKASERDEYYDKYVRLIADFDNARKRMEKDTADYVKYANESIIRELFPVLDSFDSAIAGMEKNDRDVKALDGLKLLQKQFHKVLEENGLSVISCVGTRFDPVRHEAVMKVQDDKHEDGTVVEELRRGYTLNGRVLRPAMVKVVVSDDKEE